MLRGIDSLLNGDLLKALDEMGHGDVLALVDRNYPARSAGRPVVYLGEVTSARALSAILSVFPLDNFVPAPLGRMESDPKDPATDVHDEVLAIARSHHNQPLDYRLVPRQDFYEETKAARLVVHCLEATPYSCFLLQKGVI